jgi:hypothetical protein
MILTLVVLCLITAITVAASTWTIFSIAIYVVCGSVASSILKEDINSGLRKVHFLLAVACRAHNNRVFLQHGIELRPGFHGKWLEMNAIKIKSRSRYLYHVEQRVMQQDLGD